MRQIKIFGFVALLALLVVEVLIFAPESVNLPRRQASVKDDDASPTGSSPISEQKMDGAHLVQTKDGNKEWELWAEVATGSRDRGNLTLDKTKVHMFGKQNISYTITGDRGTVLANQKDLEITGHVVTRSSNGYVFTTDRVTYDSEARSLHGPGPVHMRNEHSRTNAEKIDLTGTDMSADLNSENINIEHHVSALKGVSEKQTLTIKSNRAVFSAKSDAASFYGDVNVDMDNAKITGPKAEFVFDSGTKKIKSLVVDGGIRLSDVDRWATAERIEMLFKEDRFILSGSPRVVQNSDELFGDQIIYAHGGKDIFVNDVKARFQDAAKSTVIK
jgi:LPS export ABC transporter protein LptC/lipopolysaccharide transport protein LptA